MNIRVLGTMLATIAVAGAIFFVMQPEGGAKLRPIDPANVVKVKINMQGMTCGHCEAAIENIANNAGISKIKASSDEQKVDVEYDKTQTDIVTIMKAIDLKGFTPLSYEDGQGLHELNVSKAEASTMKCGAGKCGAK